MSCARVPRYSSTFTLALPFMLIAAFAMLVEANDGQTRTRPGQRPAPSVRIVRQSPPTACGQWRSITWEACETVAACNARRAGSDQLGALSDTIQEAAARHRDGACEALSCGPVRTRNDTNAFACRGATQLCLTRTFEFTCVSTAERTSPPARTSTPAPPRTTPQREPERRPAETSPRRPQSAGQKAATRGAEADDPTVPEGGTGQSTLARRAGGPLPTQQATTAPQRVSGPAYPFPGRADELDYGEFWYWKWPDNHGTGSQAFAYDLTTARFDTSSSQWTECVSDAKGRPKCTRCSSASQNRDCLTYGEPVYALADGVVERCWRNAPENPSPGEPHTGRTSDPRRIGGGGNMLFVRNDDGTYALYAHMQPGTIPSALCPHNQTLMKDASDRSESTVPEAQRARVRVGQFLGRVGNSGASSNPHLHVHLQTGPDKNDAGAPLDFTGGLVALADGPPDSGWSRLKGQPRPSGDGAYWPSYSSGFPEIARHAVPADEYQLLFDHAAGSGYRLAWIDGYEIGGRLYFNVLFRPRQGVDWAAVHNLTGDSYQAQFEKMKEQGRRLTFVDSYRVGNSVRYAAVFANDKGPPVAAYHGLSQAQHQDRFDKWTADGWSPKEISVTSIDGQRFYTARYERAGSGSYLARSSVAAGEYQALFEDNYKAKRQAVYVEAYEHNGQPYFSLIFSSAPSGGYEAKHGLTGATYQQAWEQARKAGLLTRCVVGYPGSGTARYAAVWGK